MFENIFGLFDNHSSLRVCLHTDDKLHYYLIFLFVDGFLHVSYLFGVQLLRA